jgi:predicted dehydrogenase
MEKVRLGFVGVGGMGGIHLGNAAAIGDVEIAGVCDVNADRAKELGEKYKCPSFTDHREMVKKENLDAVMISTPHFFHPPVVLDAFEAGVHVMCEKPLAVQVRDAQAMIDAHKSRPELKFGVMFQHRLKPMWRQMKKLIEQGETATIFRISWIITDWYRSQAYYNSGGWRGTWKGEGGGVLMNQCPHQLDLFTWLFGMPDRVMAMCKFGKYHDVEVEDDVSALFEYEDGKTASFITSTGEFPGTNRLEVACDRGRIVVEDGKIRFDRTPGLVSDFTENSADPWAKPEVWRADVPASGDDLGQKGMLENFVQAVLGKAELVAPGAEGINSLMLANAMVYSGYVGEPVDLPLDPKAYEGLLRQFVAHSQG